MIVVGGLVAAGVAVGQPPAKRAGGLDVVPADGFAFVSVNVAKVWDTPALKELRDALLKIDGADEFEQEMGFAPADLNRVTLLWPQFPVGFGSEDPMIIVTTRKPYDAEKLLKTLEADTFDALERKRWATKAAPSLPKKAEPPPVRKNSPVPTAFRRQREEPAPATDVSAEPYILGRMRRVLLLIDPTTVVFIPFTERNPTPLLAYLSQALRKQADGPLAAALAVADQHTAVAGIDFRPVRRQLDREEPFPRDLVPFRSLLQMTGGFATLDLDAKTGVTTTLRFPTAEDATRAEPVLKTAIQMAVTELGNFKKRISTNEPQAAFGVPLLDAILGALDKATVKADDTRVTAAASLEIGPTVAKAIAALPEYVKFRNGQIRTLNNLKQIGIALHAYDDTTGHFPQDIVDKAGKPILSWRVQILPYIEQDNLYRRLDLTKPWDDPANAKVLATMPKVFEVADRTGKAGETFFQMCAADKQLPGGSPVLVAGQRRGMANISDGSSNTFGVVEAATGVNWAKPGDLPFDPKKLPALGDPKTGKFRVMMMDGSVGSFRRDKVSDVQLRAFITADGGEVNTYEDR